jgi:hypothetical protein
MKVEMPPLAITKQRRSYSEIYRRVDERRLLQNESPTSPRKKKNPPSKEEPYRRTEMSDNDVSCFRVFIQVGGA